VDVLRLALLLFTQNAFERSQSDRTARVDQKLGLVEGAAVAVSAGVQKMYVSAAMLLRSVLNSVKKNIKIRVLFTKDVGLPFEESYDTDLSLLQVFRDYFFSK